MSLWDQILDLGVPLGLTILKNIGDSAVDGATAHSDLKKSMYLAHGTITFFGEKIANDTENDYDDQALQAAKELIEDTLTEAGIPIPVYPPEIFTNPEPAPEQ